jgi:hypothetical protein
MIPNERFSSTTYQGDLLNPWSRQANLSRHWGPIALQDPSAGLLVKIWQVRALQDGFDLLLSSSGVAEYVWYTHSKPIEQVSLAFDQNGLNVMAFVDADGGAFLRWFDPTVNAYVTDDISYATTPRVTLDDARLFNLSNSDVILGYVRDGIIRYRRQRDRFQNEYTPPVGIGGSPATANGLCHISLNSNLRAQFITDETGGEDWTLPEVIADVCQRAALHQERLNMRLMDWQKIVRGFTVGDSYQGAGILQTLSTVFFFDPATANGKVSFVPRGRDAAATIYEDDLIDEGDDAEIEDPQSRRQDSIGIPRVLHLNYYDVAGGLNTDKQRSERPEGTRADGEQSLQTPVVMSSDEAATVVKITHGMMVEQQKGELSFALPDNWLGLTESDPVFVQLNGKMVRAILTRSEIDDGEQRYKAIRDRQSLYTTQVQGIPAAPVQRPPSSVVGPTLIEILDIPILRDVHDQLGFYVAVSGVLPAWPGGLVEMSIDGGATYLDGQSTRASSIMGELATTLADHPSEYPDMVSVCQVNTGTPDTVLENADLAGMMNRKNRALIGNEIVCFADADEVSPGVWELSSWLRGRKGTDAAAHPVGTRFVLLDSAMFIPADLAWLNRPLTFRATTFGRPVDEATIITVTFTGQSQVERRPSYLQARRAGSDVVASWQGVGRLGAGTNVAMGAYFAGYRVTLTDGTTTQTIETTANTYNGSLSAFTGPVTVRVQQRNQLTGLGPHIKVII